MAGSAGRRFSQRFPGEPVPGKQAPGAEGSAGEGTRGAGAEAAGVCGDAAALAASLLVPPPWDTGSGLGALLALGEGQSKAKSRTPCSRQAPSLGLALGPRRDLPWLSWGTERALSGEERGDTYPVPLLTNSYPQASSLAAGQTHSITLVPRSATATHCFGGKLWPFVCINLFKLVAGTIFSNALRRGGRYHSAQLRSLSPQHPPTTHLTLLPAEPGPFRTLPAPLGSFPAAQRQRSCGGASPGSGERLVGQRLQRDRSAGWQQDTAAAPPPHCPSRAQGRQDAAPEPNAVSCSSAIIKQQMNGWLAKCCLLPPFPSGRDKGPAALSQLATVFGLVPRSCSCCSSCNPPSAPKQLLVSSTR